MLWSRALVAEEMQRLTKMLKALRIFRTWHQPSNCTKVFGTWDSSSHSKDAQIPSFVQPAALKGILAAAKTSQRKEHQYGASSNHAGLDLALRQTSAVCPRDVDHWLKLEKQKPDVRQVSLERRTVRSSGKSDGPSEEGIGIRRGREGGSRRTIALVSPRRARVNQMSSNQLTNPSRMDCIGIWKEISRSWECKLSWQTF